MKKQLRIERQINNNVATKKRVPADILRCTRGEVHKEQRVKILIQELKTRVWFANRLKIVENAD